jgi:hypothetical protein
MALAAGISAGPATIAEYRQVLDRPGIKALRAGVGSKNPPAPNAVNDGEAKGGLSSLTAI